MVTDAAELRCAMLNIRKPIKTFRMARTLLALNGGDKIFDQGGIADAASSSRPGRAFREIHCGAIGA